MQSAVVMGDADLDLSHFIGGLERLAIDGGGVVV